MAKGNNGNLLQHSIEVELGCALAGDKSPLSIFFTHSMAPFEECKKPKSKSGTMLLVRWLKWPYRTQGHPAVALAYRKVKASVQRYPNSAELLAAMLGRARLRGHLFDVNPNTIRKLRPAWAGTQVHVHAHSWRSGLSCLNSLPKGPWLMSLDPYTYLWGIGDEDDGYLRDIDIKRLVAATLMRLHDSNVPGALLIFSYHVAPNTLRAFKHSILTTFESAARLTIAFIETAPIGLYCHVCAVVTNTPSLAELAQNTWDRLVKAGSK